jgi:hypothetical protein
MNRVLAVTFAVAALLPAAALAAPGTPARVRGTIASVSASSITVDPASGAPVTVAITDKTAYLKVVKSSLSKIEPGSYIGTATKSVGSMLIALEVVVFPPAMRGAGEGHYAWDKIPDTTLSGGAQTSSSMTNGSVTTVSSSAPAVNSSMTNGSVSTASTSGGVKNIVVTYKGGQQNILVPPTAPIVTFEPGSKALLTAGAPVFVRATDAGGSMVAVGVVVGSDGVKPPM